MNPDWENFRRQDLYRSCPQLAHKRAVERGAGAPVVIAIVLILALIFGL